MRVGIFAAVAASSLIFPGVIHATGASSATVPVINTVAGGYGGPGPATTVAMEFCGAAAAGGHTYLSDIFGGVRSLNPVTDWITAPFLVSRCVTSTDGYGNLLVHSPATVVVYAEHTGVFYGQKMTAGDRYTIAGGGTTLGNGGPALKAEIGDATCVVPDQAGNLVITDQGADQIRVVAVKTGTFYGQAMKAGYIYDLQTLNGQLTSAIADHAGNVVFEDSVSAGGSTSPGLDVLAEKTAEFYGQRMTEGDIYTLVPGAGPGDVRTDGAGNVVFANGGLVQVLAASSGTFYGQQMSAGNTYTIAGGGSSTTDGVPALQAALGPVQHLCFDGSGNLLIEGSLKARVVALKNGSFYGKTMVSGDIYTVAGTGYFSDSGDGGPATSARMDGPYATGEDPAGNILISDSVEDALRLLARATGVFYGQSMTAGDMYTIAGTGLKGAGLPPNGVPALKAQLTHPGTVAADKAGNVIIGGGFSILVVAEHTGTYYGVPMTAGDIYTLPADYHHNVRVHLDSDGNLVITVPNMGIEVFAIKTGTFYGIQMTADNSYLVAGGGSGPVASGIPALNADLQGASNAVVDGSGNLVITDYELHLIRVVAVKTGVFYGQSMRAGYIYTVAGPGNGAVLGDGGPALKARIKYAQSVTTDSAGNLVVDDEENNEIRVIAVKTGTFYGQQMKAGYIYRIAGGGARGFGGDGGPAIDSALNTPTDVRFVPGYGLLVTDEANDRIRLISG
jgi:hypothetical protein